MDVRKTTGRKLFLHKFRQDVSREEANDLSVDIVCGFKWQIAKARGRPATRWMHPTVPHQLDIPNLPLDSLIRPRKNLQPSENRRRFWRLTREPNFYAGSFAVSVRATVAFTVF
ncbi:MAG TPA: hypothetical protein VHY35_00145 [Stellaceae bacterium]|nr:hypothetical protein [Stellaceae bacterium]